MAEAPDGGDAEARYTMDLPAQGRPATKAGAAGFKGTIYVGPGGKVLAAVSVTIKDGEGHADCVAKVLARMRGLPSPLSWPAKVTFGL